MRTVDKVFESEDRMNQEYFDSLSFQLLNSSIYECLVVSCHSELLTKGLPELVGKRDY